MFEQDFYHTHKSEAFVQSQCLFHEQSLVNFINSQLIMSGYKNTAPRQWQKHNKKVVVCLVDDFRICSNQFYQSSDKWFDADTTVITDNRLCSVTDYVICKTPDSYFGIYNYIPTEIEFAPRRRFHISINRVDSQRMLLFFELYRQLGGFEKDHVNFNCRIGDAVIPVSEVQQHFDSVWHSVSQQLADTYQQICLETRKLVPLRNHNLSIEQASVGSYINLVIETYAGDATIAFSEKIFRALVTPAPWMVYSAQHAVAYLEQLGFDVLADIVDHSYDAVLQDNSYMGIDKIKNFVVCSQQNHQNILHIDTNFLKNRCTQAAKHNQKLLANMAQQWPRDCVQWLAGVIEKIQ